VKAANLALRFLLELCLLAAFAAWGFGRGGVSGVLLGIGVPVAAATVWGLLVAPKAPNRLPDPWRLALELVLFALGTAALAAAGYGNLALVFGVAVVANEALTLLWRQRGTA
jgi:hypothetical protein